VTGTVPLFTALNAAMLPDPEPPRPMLVLLLTQSKLAPAVPLKLMAVVIVPLHTTSLEKPVTVGVGSTVIVNDSVGPAHGPLVGVTTIVAITGAVPLFTAVNEGMLPVPVADNPIDGVSLVHE